MGTLVLNDDDGCSYGLVLGDVVVMAAGGGGATNRLLLENGDGLLLEDSSGDLELQ